MKQSSVDGWLGTAALLCWHAAAFATATGQEKPVAASAETAVQVVEVAGLRDVDEKRYRKIFKGMEVFEENHQLAPAASLRFRLYPRSKNASFAGLRVNLSRDGTNMPIALDDDHSFRLPKSADMAKDDALVTTNKKLGTYAWRVDIRTPGLPPNTRRLGDLRLECKVDMKGAELRQMIRDPSIMALVAVSDPCTFRTFTNPFFADRPVFNVTLVSGTRRESIASDWLYGNSTRVMPDAMYELVDWRYTRDRQYIPPIADSNWPDDTLLEFDYMDDSPDANKADVAAAPVRQETERQQ
ncbi:MAG: hypothetical protein QFF03_16550 [Pseudomonadota bacterium]|nr:hypothetical protein [Pseudomonadota bacterium]